jgi:aryl-phospho-beta-D-glucosidase BglC (GH1 family)
VQRTSYKFLLALAAAALVAAIAPAVSYAGVLPDASADRPASPSSALSTVAAMQPGWNLGNSLDATGADETSWGNPRITQELLRGVRAQGFKSIRIPVTWGQHQGPAPAYQIDPAYLARVNEVVNWALADGFYVLINIHHDSWQWVNTMPTDHDAVLARYSAIWTQIAATFRGAPRKLLFESVNEPFFTGSTGAEQNAALMRELNTTFHTIVRQSGGNNATRLLVLPTLSTSADQGRVDELTATFTELNDPNLVATVHFYGFWPFSVNIAGFTQFNAAVQKDLTDTFDRVYNAFVAKGIPVIIGEYGLLGFDRNTGTIEHGETLKYFEFLGAYARARHITTMLWDNGQHFNRTTLQWNDPDLYRQMKSSWSVSSSTASTDQVFVRKGSAPADQTVTLNLNGNRLTSIVNGSKMLARGKDYTVDGDQLTFAAATIAKLTAAQAYGVNATLSVRFSRGTPWKISVITYDPPVLSSATGTTASLVIPTAFNGDQLATMEAKYADGTNAGPQNWTPYKEFGYTFAPNTGAGQITLLSTLFAEIADNSTVNLTFHFWSGATVAYTVTRSGTTVTGTAAS